MVQTPPETTIFESYNNIRASGKEELRFLQLIQAWKFDRMYGMPSDALGLMYFGVVSDPMNIYPTSEG